MLYKFQDLILIFILFMFVAKFNHRNTYSQKRFTSQDTLKNVIGKFNSPRQSDNNFTSEAISINADSTFEYILRTEFTKIKASGNWHVSNTSLILNSKDKREKINVEEKKNRNDKIKFDVTYKSDEPIYFQLYLITSKDTLYIKDAFGDTTINHLLLKGFYIIDTRGFRYPTYFLKERNSNYFRVWLEKERIFDNEAWQIKDNGNKLQPIGLSGNLMDYCLVKQ